jgi:hypothetical protein
MIVLTMDGWDRSFGVRAEIELCHKLSIPIKYLDPSSLRLMDLENVTTELRNGS